MDKKKKVEVGVRYVKGEKKSIFLPFFRGLERFFFYYYYYLSLKIVIERRVSRTVAPCHVLGGSRRFNSVSFKHSQQ